MIDSTEQQRSQGQRGTILTACFWYKVLHLSIQLKGTPKGKTSSLKSRRGIANHNKEGGMCMNPKQYLVLLLLILSLCPKVEGLNFQSSSLLLMEESTGQILYEENPHNPQEPASVTKVMSILLILEGIDQGRIAQTDSVIISETAAGMGGSQVYLEQGEVMTVAELLKCVVVVSANDATVALAEHLCGSEEAFVQEMNAKAKVLGMTQSQFQNATGLPAENHKTTAYDIAIMSRTLLTEYPQIQELTTIWMDSIRGGSFGLSNTNRLIHSYTGATGLKTGSTESAGFCLSATATRDGLSLIAVVLESPSSDIRFAEASTLLDYGFQNYSLETIYPESPILATPIILGERSHSQGVLQQEPTILLDKSQKQDITSQVTLLPEVEAPVQQGQQLGSFDIYVQGNLHSSIPILATEEVPRLSLWGIYRQLLEILFMK